MVIVPCCATATELQAGVARVDLTPPLSMKAPLGGYGARMNRPAQGVHDRIFAKALVVSDGKRKFALVTADMLGFAPAFKPALVERLAAEDWSAEQILLLPSHSHTSIEMNAINPRNVLKIPQIGIHDPALFELTLKKFVDVIQRAEHSLQPVVLGTASRQVPGFNRNRRERGGLTDDELTVTRIDTLAGKPLAVLVNFTAHPTFMSEKEMLFSGGWPGQLQRTIEAAVGEGVTAMYYNGAEGDQAPVGRPDSGDSPWEKAERYGLELGLIAAETRKEAVTQRDVAFDFHLQDISLPERRWHPDFMSTGGKEYGLSEAIMGELLTKLAPSQTTSGSVRLGDLVIVGIPGELSAELGLRIKSETKAATGATHAVIGGLANEWISYILTAESYIKGSGYEASVSFYGPELGDRVTKAAVQGAAQLKSPGAVQESK
jgi:Neutral/alkaline non-lysosomal ceramidase, N-terminal